MIRIFLRLFSVAFAAGLLWSCNPQGQDDMFSEADQKKEVWKAVEKRFYSWKDNDYEAHMSVYHPDWRRWSLNSRKLMKRDDFTSLWNTMKDNEQVIDLDLEPVEITFYNGGRTAIVHFISTESFLWIGQEETNTTGKTIGRGSVQTSTMRWSDVMVKEDGKWLYVGGHRDGGSIDNEE